jgi:hypothetical protein
VSLPSDPRSSPTPASELWAKGRAGDVFLIFALLLFLAVQLLLMPLPYLETDEAAFGACAVRQLSLSALPLTQCVDIKPPGIFAIYEAIYAIFGNYSGVGLRLFGAAAVASCAAALYSLTRLATNKPVAKSAAAIFVLISASSLYLLALKTELIAITLVQISLILILKFRDNDRLSMLVAAGFFAGLSILFKQPATLFCVSMTLSLYFISRAPDRILNWMRNVAVLGVSVVTSLSAIALIYAMGGHWQDFVQQIWSRPALYAAQGSDVATALRNLARAPQALPLPTILIAALLSFATLAAITGRESRYVRLLQINGWWMAPAVLCACIVISLGGRFFPSYFIFLLPFLCIALGIAAQPIFDAIARSRVWDLGAVLCAGLAAVIVLVSMYNLKRVLKDGLSDAEPVLAYAQPRDQLYVWGYTPEFYAATKMIPASRFVVTSLLVGHFFEESNGPPERQMTYVQPGDWDLFLQDLKQAKSFMFIDANSLRMGKPGDFAPQHYPRMKQFMDTYCTFKTRIGPMPLYRCVVGVGRR